MFKSRLFGSLLLLLTGALVGFVASSLIRRNSDTTHLTAYCSTADTLNVASFAGAAARLRSIQKLVALSRSNRLKSGSLVKLVKCYARRCYGYMY
jgi:hypothetical protein